MIEETADLVKRFWERDRAEVLSIALNTVYSTSMTGRQRGELEKMADMCLSELLGRVTGAIRERSKTPWTSPSDISERSDLSPSWANTDPDETPSSPNLPFEDGGVHSKELEAILEWTSRPATTNNPLDGYSPSNADLIFFDPQMMYGSTGPGLREIPDTITWSFADDAFQVPGK